MVDVNKIATEVADQILREENLARKKVVVFGGRFQPFHEGHFKTYKHLIDKFGRENVYIGTSNKIEKPRSPFSFKEKKKIMSKMFRIPKDKIVQVKNAYTPKEILKKFDDDTAFIAVVGKKDKNRLGGSYFDDYKENISLEGYRDKGYVYVADVPNSFSGTDVRNKLGDPALSKEMKKNEFKRFYSKLDNSIFDLVTDKLTESVVLEWIIERNGKLFEIPKKDVKKVDTYADKQLDPIDIDLSSNHFFDRLNDSRNKKDISMAELIGFFKRLKRNKKEFIEFLNKYKQIVVTDNRSKINIPFMKKANKAIAKTIMRKPNFKTSNVKLTFEKLQEAPYAGNMGFEEMMKFYDIASNSQISKVEKLIDRGEEKKAWKIVQDVVGVELKGKEFRENFDRRKFYEEHIKKLVPESFNISSDGNKINVEVPVKEAQFKLNKGFTFVARKSAENLKKGLKYVIDDIKGRAGDLTVMVKRFGSNEEIPVHVRSEAEFYSDIIGENYINENQILNEGGAYGHMSHPFDLEIDLTFGDLKKIVNMVLEGELGITREKTDGQALAVSWRDDRGGLIAARNKSHLKNSGKGAMDLNDLKSKFSGRGKLTDAYTYAMKDLEKAIGSLSDKQREEIFQNGSSFMNIEVIFTENPNVIPYGQNLLVFHGTMQYDEDGNAIGENRGAARTLADMIEKVNANVQDHYELQGPPILELPKSEDLSKKKPKYMKAIKKLQKEFNLSDNDGVGEYHQAWWENWVEENAPRSLDNKTMMYLVKRWAFDDKSNRINGKTMPDDEIKDWAKKVDKKRRDKIAKKNLNKFENIFLAVGAEVLSYFSSVLAVNPDKALRKMKDDLDKTINDIKKSGDEADIKKLEKELKRLERVGGVEKIVPNEGIVFVYKGHTLKLTGAFAPLNKIMGIMQYK